MDADSALPEALTYLSAGKSGIVFAIDQQRVLKKFHDSDGKGVESRAYQRLGSHPNIAQLLDIQSDGSIVLERGRVLRDICRYPSAIEIPIQSKLGWLKHAANGYRHMHDCGILHGDVGCNNMIVNQKGYLKIIDLEGCSIDGEPANSCYEWFSYRPSMPRVSRSTDIFAFGCAIYEVVTGKPPYYELRSSDDPHRQVEQLYTKNCFPNVTPLPLGRLMQSCWHGDISSMSEIIQELEAFPIPT